MFQLHQRQSHIHAHRREVSPAHDPVGLRAYHQHERRGYRKILDGSPTGNRSSFRQGYYPYCWGFQRKSRR